MPKIPDFEPPRLRLPLSPRDRAAVDSIKTLIIPLGPYRNLTTLLGAVLSLHPEAMVLNHAADRFSLAPEADYIGSPDADHREAFLKLAVQELQSGRRGWYGGSILEAHAFDSDDLKAAYQRRFGNELVKAAPKALFWKDSMRLQKRLLETGTLDEFFSNDDNKAVYTVRNPIHVARSNLATGLWDQLVEPGKQDFKGVLRAVLSNFRWALDHPTIGPKLLVVWEQDFLASGLRPLCAHSGITFDAEWASAVQSSVNIRTKPTDPEDKAIFHALCDEIFEDDKETYTKLIYFLDI